MDARDASAELVGIYQAVLSASEKMSAAAREGRWDELLDIEPKRLAALDEISRADLATLSPDARQTIAGIIQAILRLDEETRVACVEYHDDVGALLSVASTEKKLRDAYGSEPR